MPKKKDIDGKKLGQKLLDAKTYIDLPNVTLKRLTNLRHDTFFKKKWEILWQWRSIPETERVTFFKVQALLRNEKAQKKKESFIKKNDLRGFYKYVEDNWYIYAADLIGYDEGTRLSKYTDPEMIIPSESLEEILSNLSDSKRKELASAMKAQSPWIVAATLAEPEEVISEVFSEKDYIGHYATSKDGINFNFDYYYETSRNNLLGQIALERYNREPTMYLRINLKHYNANFETDINRLIRRKIKEINCKKASTADCLSWELALMIHDLSKEGFRDQWINVSIEKISKQTIDVQEKKRQANRLIERSILPLKDFTSA